jgi:hypothetical protein
VNVKTRFQVICKVILFLSLHAASAWGAPSAREKILTETLSPYIGPTVKAVDTTTLSNKVMCGYQGWFNTASDGAGKGWFHWTKDRKRPLSPGNAKIDLWPDLSELGPDERFATGFTNANGQVAEVFSSSKKETVLRHFQWMRDYGIDGAFVQRFVVDLRDPAWLRGNNKVLANCREGANRYGRAYAVMYDLSGLGTNSVREVMDDWRSLRTRMHVTDDPAYLHHRGRPLVAVWGVGFNDGRHYTIEDCRQIIEFLKKDGCSVMVGVPTWFREMKRDTTNDPALHQALQLADIVSPWTTGRYNNPVEVRRDEQPTWRADIAWCTQRNLDFLPVVFPGFSWFNMNGGKFNQIPRLKGQFLWSQFVAAKHAGASMVYVGMFDEVDEGTAIFKCTNEVPIGGPNKFVTYEGLPSDFYLWLTGQGAKMLRGELPITDALPQR